MENENRKVGNELLRKDQISNILPKWQHPIVPGHARQGSLLMSTTDFVNPPQSQENFMWMLVEDLVGTHDVRLLYDERINQYLLQKAKGHPNNDGTWTLDWFDVGKWDALTPETVEALLSLVYVNYRFDTTVPQTLKVYGIRKDGTEDMLVNVRFADADYVDTLNPISGIATEVEHTEDGQPINVLVDDDTIKVNSDNQLYAVGGTKSGIATNVVKDTDDKYKVDVKYDSNKALGVDSDNELYVKVDDETIKIQDGKLVGTQQLDDGIATDINDDNEIDVLVDNDSIIVNDSNQLKANVINDTLETSATKTWSINKIKNFFSTPLKYKGNKNTYAEVIALTDMVPGDMWHVVADGHNYAYGEDLAWHDLGTEYIAGAGIDITGKVISATGVSFGTGDGLKITGSGASAILEVFRATGSPIKFNSDKSMDILLDDETVEKNTSNEIKVKHDDTLAVTENGLSVNVDNTKGVEITADEKVAIKIGDGLTFTDDGKLDTIDSTRELTLLHQGPISTTGTQYNWGDYKGITIIRYYTSQYGGRLCHILFDGSKADIIRFANATDKHFTVVNPLPDEVIGGGRVNTIIEFTGLNNNIFKMVAKRSDTDVAVSGTNVIIYGWK